VLFYALLRGQLRRWGKEAAGRMAAEEAVREQADLLNLTHDSVLVMDMEGVIKYWNRAAAERYDWTAGQAVGRVVYELLKTVFPKPREEIIAEVTRTGRWEGELVHTRKDGTQVVVASRWALQRGEQGAPVAILETNNDITERKRTEEALRRSEAYLAEGQLSHTRAVSRNSATGRSTYWSSISGTDLNPEQGVPITGDILATNPP
jgi:PAS domain S-box-containing protein